MRPAFSVLLLTTLIGAAQGLFIALTITELLLGSSGEQAYAPLLACGGGIAAVLSVIGLLASFFHLGHPMRAWRAVAGWRTSWLSREVIVLPAFIAAAAVYALLHLMQPGSYLGLGLIGSLLAIALFVCTGMIYAAVKAIREWASSLTVINFTLMGLASGTTLAAALATLHAPELARLYAVCAVALSAIAAIGHVVAQARIRQLAPAATMQSAIGVRHPKVTQRSQGAMGGSFNTREFFHGQPQQFFDRMMRSVMPLGFALPVLLLASGLLLTQATVANAALLLAFPVQLAGLLIERWVFFAQVNHPQNLYYRTVG
jgi:DMSO reductase anchor subunit